VFYEIGIAHTVGKPVILISQEKDDMPFDLEHMRFIVYSDSPEGLKALDNQLKKAISSVIGDALATVTERQLISC
jgi:hypothetical protein